MTSDAAQATKYLWVMEWYDPFDDPPSTDVDVYRLELPPGTQAADFERFMADEMFPAVGNRPTRRAHVVAHYLFKVGGDVRDTLDEVFGIYVQEAGVRERFRALCTEEPLGSFALVGSWGREPRSSDG